MSHLAAAQELSDSGRFDEAFTALSSVAPADRIISSELLRAELLERLGRPVDATIIAQQLLLTPEVTAAQRSGCELVLGRAAWELGDSDGALEHLQRAVWNAQVGKDSQRLCWAQLRLLLLVAERTSADAVAPILSELRANIASLADTTFTAALHIGLGEVESKRGLLDIARRHLDVGEELLGKSRPNAWLYASALNARLAIALLENDFTSAISVGERALAAAEESGSASAVASALTNLGNAHFSTGAYDRAAEYFDRAERSVPSAHLLRFAVTETMARIQLAQGQVDRAEALLRQIDEHPNRGSEKSLYIHRHTELTRIAVLIRRGDLKSASQAVGELLNIAGLTGDRRLFLDAKLARLEIAVRQGDFQTSSGDLTDLLGVLDLAPPESLARFEGLLACALRSQRRTEAAICHRERARRLLIGIDSAPGLSELKEMWSRTGASQEGGESIPGTGRAERADALWSLMTALLVCHRADLLGREVFALLTEAGSIGGGRVTLRQKGKQPRVLASFGQVPEGEQVVRIVSGVMGESVCELELLPNTEDVTSTAAIHAAEQLVAALAELRRSRGEALRRIQLWPNEEARESTAVLNGEMRKIMDQASRVARTNVTVLITGESGTGKEILARAIHDFSPRAARPFLPFNCTAIPRDLMEGQMFGHRRGAFTGADRDHPGIIRAARDGTLFLDEIGELGLDLQPKLLRFLESGEILPLGETQPLKVDVRVLAATNRELDQLVANGSFREDLFYRLNVVHLRVPPLRERRDEIPALAEHFARLAAREYDKGDIRVSPDAMEYLLLFRWPGNVRQLANEVRRIVVLAERNSTIEPDHLSAFITTGTIKPAPASVHVPEPTEILVRLDQPLADATEQLERTMLAYAMKQAGGRLEDAATLLGLSRKGLYLKRQRLGLN